MTKFVIERTFTMSQIVEVNADNLNEAMSFVRKNVGHMFITDKGIIAASQPEKISDYSLKRRKDLE